MKIPLKLRKSAGVAVTLAAHTHIRAGNAARDRHDWPAAIEAYRAALTEDPSLAHIWIQLGHALKEESRFNEAAEAYASAAELLPASGDPFLHLGHLHKRTGDRAAAAQAYLQAARLSPHDPDALAEAASIALVEPADILALLAEGSDPSPAPISDTDEAMAAREALARLEHAFSDAPPQQREALHAALATAGAMVDALESSAREQATAAGPALVFDVSDLISYFRNARLPTGIQRVQIETIVAALRDPSRSVQVCAFFEQRDTWVEVPAPLFRALAGMSLTDGDRSAREWVAALARVQLVLASAPAMPFPQGAYLVNLGTSWWLQNYFLRVREAKARHGVRYVPFVHDLIPVMASEHCIRELTQDFISWAMGAFEHADRFLVNSEATKRDLLRVAGILGHSVADGDVVVIPLNADFRKPATGMLPATPLAQWGLARERFVLFVSTIESRKNHLAAFEAWITLIKRHGARAVPKLVCVGNRGWLNDAVYARLETHEALRSRVVMLSGLSDAELETLYRACLFTLYPSRYEGWGLPVTESLCYGKVPLISDASSLPEAGGHFAAYFPPDRTDLLSERLEQLIFDDGVRSAMEARIATDFAPRTWGDIAASIAVAIDDWADADQAETQAAVPLVAMGRYHPFVRNVATRIWPGMRSAEIFRAGGGWWGPDDWGCWTRSGGGRLELRIPPGVEAVRLSLRLHGMPSRACRYRVANGETAMPNEGALRPGEFKWVMLVLRRPEDGIVRIEVEADASENLADVTDGRDLRIVSVGVAGFFVCDDADTAARLAFVEALSTHTLEDLCFGCEEALPMAPALRLAS